MRSEISFFPLNIVVFPNEPLNLHIFEERYKQLINDCLETGANFGIPAYINKKIEIGTEVEILEVSKVYDDGKMDIKTRGLRVFEVKKFEDPWRDKLYAGGEVHWRLFETAVEEELRTTNLKLMKELFHWLQMEEKLSIDTYKDIYTYIHKIGLKKEEEYAILKMETETIRQKFIQRHLQKLLPALERAEEAREKIRMNGHFKHFDPLKF